MSERKFSDRIEENFIAITLGLMTLITFANVLVRYLGNGNILWALETTVFLFAWLVLIGASYAVKKNLHMGVDILVGLLPASIARLVSLVAVLACLVFTGLVLYGAFEYWLPFASDRAWYEVDDIPAPGFMQFLAEYMNEGEQWEKLPRFIPYFCLPVGFSLLLYRFLQAFMRVYRGEQKLIVASHEVDK